MKYNFQSHHNDERVRTINEPVFLLTVHRSQASSHATVNFQPVYLHVTKDGVETLDYYCDDYKECALGLFSVRGLFDISKDGSQLKDIVGWKTGYETDDTLTIEREEVLQLRVKFLSRISKSTSKMIAEFGRPQNFLQHVVYVADALGINRYIIKTNVHYPIEYKFIPVTSLEEAVLKEMNGIRK